MGCIGPGMKAVKNFETDSKSNCQAGIIHDFVSHLGGKKKIFFKDSFLFLSGVSIPFVSVC